MEYWVKTVIVKVPMRQRLRTYWYMILETLSSFPPATTYEWRECPEEEGFVKMVDSGDPFRVNL